jgi:hypothetical protein
MSADQAFVALSTVLLSSLGMMLIELELRAASGGAGVIERLEALRQHTEDAAASEHPLTQEALQGLDGLQLGQLHDQTLDLLLAGAEQRLAEKLS